jgi:hypothetical protein
MSTTYIIFFGVDHCSVSTYLYKFLPMYQWRIGNIFLSPRTRPLFSSAIKVCYHDINILQSWLYLGLSLWFYHYVFNKTFLIFCVVWFMLLHKSTGFQWPSGKTFSHVTGNRNELSRHPLIKPIPSLQARFQMHWDTKILVNCLPQGRPPSHMAMFSLQKMWHDKRETTV